jgi:hypothetical protein
MFVFFLSSICAQCENFVPILLRLRDALATQLQDLRSAVAKEACAVVCFLARHLRQRSDHLMEELLPVIFRLLVRSHTGVFTDSAHATARCVLKHVRAPRLMHRLLVRSGGMMAGMRGDYGV